MTVQKGSIPRFAYFVFTERIMKRYLYLFYVTSILSLLIFFPQHLSAQEFVLDDENCMMCHKYPGLSRVSNEGYLRLFYIDSDKFTKSLHTKVKCTGCHQDIKKIPHNDAKKVDCTTQCHIEQPETKEKFSHKNVAEVLKKSIHNPDHFDVNNKIVEDFPECTDCHKNPLYVSFADELKRLHGTREDPEKILKKCDVCHEKRDFYEYFFNHVTYRINFLFPGKEGVDLCVKCHAKEDMAKQHKLKNAAATYLDTFHGKAVLFDMDDAPTCIDCHVKSGESAHLILSHKNPESSVYETTRYKACDDIRCHPGATEGLGQVRMHVVIDKDMYPAEYYTALFFTALTLGVFVFLMFLLFLELLREMFPNLKIRKDK